MNQVRAEIPTVFKQGQFGLVPVTFTFFPRVLDVGCGANPVGDVNVDLYVGKSEHRAGLLIQSETPNFVLCAAEHLPFKGNTFEKVFSKDTLEHVGTKPQKTNPAPYLAFKEMVRVSKRTVEIFVPHRFSLSNCEKRFWIRQHNAFFNLRWFEQIIPKIERELNVKLSIVAELLFKPLLIYFLMMPDEIHITLIKRGEQLCS
ncbi:MAG: class I SAM-dependent methyltransferase [Candidatus Bathyarchaeota archaeon]|nr:class I SAM-dependent methyltransferase [Candidatus Bathyarchaeota archaeon]